MTITFENESDVITYAFERILFHAKKNQQIFVAQCVWWLASITGLERGLINYIDNIRSRVEVTVTSDKTPYTPVTTSKPIDKEQPNKEKSISPVPRDVQEESRRDQVLEECEEYLKESRRLRDIVDLKKKGVTRTGRINPARVSKKSQKKKDKFVKKQSTLPKNRLTGIEEEEIERRLKEGECLRCAWPADRKGGHKVKDCYRPVKTEKGTSYPIETGKIRKQPHESEKDSSVRIGWISSSNDEL